MYNKILIGQSTQVLDQGFIQLIDYMGTDDTIVQAAKVSFGNEEMHDLVSLQAASEIFERNVIRIDNCGGLPQFYFEEGSPRSQILLTDHEPFFKFARRRKELLEEIKTKDEILLRLLMRHNHGTPFEMCEVMFRVQVPMDCWRQWIR